VYDGVPRALPRSLSKQMAPENRQPKVQHGEDQDQKHHHHKAQFEGRRPST
jgi:hypothetical protein